MFVTLALTWIIAAEPAGPKLASQEYQYSAYWLSSADSEYRTLLVANVSLDQLSELVALRERVEIADRALGKQTPPLPLLDHAALTISTYQKDSIWNQDLRPLKPVTRFKSLNENDQTVEVNGTRYRYKKCPLAEVVRLLKSPEGKIPIHRLHAPLAGMEQTARALRLLLEEQLSDNQSKKK